jgi:hypothetical protein
MGRDDDKRNFALREPDGNETSLFSGTTPRQAALKAARRLNPADREDTAERHELRLQETSTQKVHVYEAWAWREEAPSDRPEWMPEVITQTNVRKQRIEYLEDS